MVPTTTPVPLPQDWARIHQTLVELWEKCQDHKIPKPLAPLILAGTMGSTPKDIRQRWISHIEWANKYGFSKNLKEIIPSSPDIDVAKEIAGLPDGEHRPKIIKTILCVDDDETTVEMISNYLIQKGYKIFTVFSAEEALEVLSKYHIDLVMTDIVMPGMDGLELTKIIKNNYDSDVIIFTGYREGCNYEKAISIGASDFFYKPFKFEHLHDSIKRISGT